MSSLRERLKSEGWTDDIGCEVVPVDYALDTFREWLEEQHMPEPSYDPWDGGYRACMLELREKIAAAPDAMGEK